MDNPGRPTDIATGRHVARLGSEPRISVVLVSEDPHSLLDASLAALFGPSRRPGADVVVVRAGSEPAERSRLEASYPAARFVFTPSGTPISRLRAQGMAAAEGDIVIFVDGRKPLPRDLLDGLEAAQSGQTDPGGPGEHRVDFGHSAPGGADDSPNTLAAIGKPAEDGHDQKQRAGG